MSQFEEIKPFRKGHMHIRTFEDIIITDMAYKTLEFFSEPYHYLYNVKDKHIAELIALELIEVTVRDLVRDMFKITPRGEDILKQLREKKGA